MPSIIDIMSGVSKQLTASIEANRIAFEHRLTKGEAIEESVRKFLRDHLPSSIGIAHGQVMDRHGTLSTQLDAILYDTSRTPILFSDEAKGNRLIPIEGVIAAVEVRTELRLDQIAALVENARVLKTLDRSAYYRKQERFIIEVVHAYGREWEVMPPLYFVFAFEGPPSASVGQAVHEAQAHRELHERIDMVCVLQRGVVANARRDRTGFQALPTPDSEITPVETEHALLLFYILMSRYVLQTTVPPISIQSYLGSSQK